MSDSKVKHGTGEHVIDWHGSRIVCRVNVHLTEVYMAHGGRGSSLTNETSWELDGKPVDESEVGDLLDGILDEEDTNERLDTWFDLAYQKAKDNMRSS